MVGIVRTAVIAVWVMLGAAALAVGEGVDLKVTRIALFSSGVGCLECEAAVEGSAAAELKFRTDQINDILKSLVVQDLDGGSIGAVGYTSQDPVEKTLRSFAVDVSGEPTLATLLGQLRGEPVEVAGPRAMKGAIVSVETQRIQRKDDEVVEFDMLNVLTETGLQQMRLSEVQGIRLTNEKIDAELRKALATLATSHDADKKSVVIRFDGQGKRRVRATYLLETPIWKTTYRLVLASDAKPFLQGWATVENATEEDWKDVKLSLVSGRPISFTMDLYTPLYVDRPEEEIERYASLRPPEYAAGMGGMMGGGMMGGYGGGGAGRSAAGASKQSGKPAARGEGKTRTGGEVAEGAGEQPQPAAPLTPAPPAETAAAGLQLAERGVQSVAAAREAGELFEYAIKTPVSIGRQRSAMLPIVNQEIAGEKLSVYNPATHPKHPLNGLQVENTTDLNLMQGPVTVFDTGVYAGDAKLPDLRPGEKRLIGYALDLAVEVTTEQKPHPEELMSLRIEKGTLWYRHKFVDERTYNMKNKDKKDRTILIEQGYGGDWKLIEPNEPYERAQNLSRFKVIVPAGKTASQLVRLERLADQSVVLSQVGLDAIEVCIRNKVVSATVKTALEKVVAIRTELDRIIRERAAREKEVKESVDEQARVRENLKTLQQNSDPYQRQLKKFDALETQIEKLRGQIAELRQQEENKRKELENYLLSLTVE